MADNLPPLQQIDPDIFRQGTAAFRELVAIKANVYVLSRPPLFVPGTEPLRIEGTVERILPNNILRVNTDLGSFALRPMDSLQIRSEERRVGKEWRARRARTAGK